MWRKIALLSVSMNVLIACAGALKYPYFGMGMHDECFEKGTLLGVNEDGEFDEDFDERMAQCRDWNCLVMKVKDHERLETDLAEREEELKTCEKLLEDCQGGCSL